MFIYLKKYVHDPKHVLNLDMIQVEPKGEFQTKPLWILYRKVTVLWNWSIGHVKVQWKEYGPKESTWEMEDSM